MRLPVALVVLAGVVGFVLTIAMLSMQGRL